MMEVKLKLLTTKQLIKGYTLLEMMLVMFIISTLMTQLVVVYQPFNRSEEYLFEIIYLKTQIKALATKEKQTLENLDSNVDILSFNAFGHVNLAQTIQVLDNIIVVQLGMGRYERR